MILLFLNIHLGGYGPSGGSQGGYGQGNQNPGIFLSHEIESDALQTISLTDNNCNNPGHQHTTSHAPRPPTRPITTKKTTTYTPSKPTQRPTPKPSQHPTYTPRPTASTTQGTTQTYPPRPTNTPNPTGSSGSGNLGVQPPATKPTTPNPNIWNPGYQPPFFIIPYPFPIAPSCPCYAVEPTGSQSSPHQHHQQALGQWQNQNQFGNSSAQLQWQSQFAIGFIPVLFTPHCFSGGQQMPGQYLQVPYPCAQCNQSDRNGRELESSENYSSSDSFKQVLAQAGVDIFSNSLVKSPNRKRARKLKRISQVEEPHLNELPENEQSAGKDEN